MDDIQAHLSDLKSFAARRWDESILGELEAYIRIPALSPHFDEDWAEHGYIAKAADHIYRWCEEQPIEGAISRWSELAEREG